MQYQKSTVELIRFSNMEFMVASAGEIAAINEKLYDDCDGFGGLAADGSFNCSSVQGVTTKPPMPNSQTSVTVGKHTFTWTETGNSGKWTCSDF